MQTTRGTSLNGPGASTDPDSTAIAGRRRHVGVLVAVAALVIAADVISKIIVVAKLSGRAPVRLLDGLLTLDYTRNAGAAFSIGTGATYLFGIVAIAVIVVIVRTSRRLFSRPWAVVLGLLLGGATGNLIDRLVRSPGVLRGYVVDWIQLPHFAVFNLADSAISIGGVLAVLLALMGRQLDGSVAHSQRASASQRTTGRHERNGTTAAGPATVAGPTTSPDEPDS